MKHRPLGKTGLQISVLSFGAGPVSTLLVGEDRTRQRAVVERALSAGINWFDTAATYGDGQSERSLGIVLEELDAHRQVHVATKVRLLPHDLGNIGDSIWRSIRSSLDRLRRKSVTLLQLHNSVTRERGDEPTSLTPADVLGPGGVLETFQQVRREGLAEHLGLTGIGQPEALREVVRSGQFATMQVPFHMLNPSAGANDLGPDFRETDYGNIIADCAAQQMGVLAIRVLAGGALAGNEPSPHTLKTPFFPLDLFERDRAAANAIRARLPPGESLPQRAIRFVLDHSSVSSALIGFGEPWQIDQALEACSR